MKVRKAKPGIAGMGFYFPAKVLETKEIAHKMKMSNKLYEYIGVNKIFCPEEDDQPTKMAYIASERALADANIKAKEIDLIIISVFKNDFLNWQMSSWLKNKLNAANAMTLEVKGSCYAHFQAIEIAVNQIQASEEINTVLVVSAERLYGYGWPSFMSAGSQAIIITNNSTQFEYLGFETNNYIDYFDMAFIPEGGTITPFSQKTNWKGVGFVDNVIVNTDMYLEHIKPVFFDKVVEVTERLLKKTGHSIENINYLLTLVQQKNFDNRISEVLGIPNVMTGNSFKSDLGHFSGADGYILLDKARKNNKIKKGDLILNIVIGGVAWFATLIRY